MELSGVSCSIRLLNELLAMKQLKIYDNGQRQSGLELHSNSNRIPEKVVQHFSSETLIEEYEQIFYLIFFREGTKKIVILVGGKCCEC